MERSPSDDSGSHSNSGRAEQSAWIGRTLPNGLRILDEIAANSDGMLYRAERATGHAVAILIPLHRHSLFLQATRIQHLNVAAVHEVGQIHDGPGYVVLELLAGEPLSDLLAERHALPAREAVELFSQAAAGVEAAHVVGLVHANLSPENFLVTETAGGPLVKLIGFAPLAWSSPSIGAPEHKAGGAYASPERLAGHHPDARSDVYSLGAILHHMLAGSPPSPGSDIPGSIGRAVTRAMHPIPEQRFQTVSELTQAVKRAVALEADPGRARSRRPLLLTAAGVVAVLAAGGLWQSASTSRHAPGFAPAQEAGIGEAQVANLSMGTGEVVVTPPPGVVEAADSALAEAPRETTPTPAPVDAPAARLSEELGVAYDRRVR